LNAQFPNCQRLQVDGQLGFVDVMMEQEEQQNVDQERGAFPILSASAD
jgi:hypothetical protein